MQNPKRKYFKEKIGMVFRINLNEGTYGYGQVATKGDNVFFDHMDVDGHFTPVGEILEKPVAFYATVDRYVLKEGLWEILGIWPVKPENQVFPESFGYDLLKETYFIWGAGMKKELCTLEETYGRECLASCGHGLIEQRLRDHFAKRPCYFVEQDRAQHLKNFPPIKEFYKQYGYDFHWLDDKVENQHAVEVAK